MVECLPRTSRLGSIPGWVILKSVKMKPTASLLGTQSLRLVRRVKSSNDPIVCPRTTNFASFEIATLAFYHSKMQPRTVAMLSSKPSTASHWPFSLGCVTASSQPTFTTCFFLSMTRENVSHRRHILCEFNCRPNLHISQKKLLGHKTKKMKPDSSMTAGTWDDQSKAWALPGRVITLQRANTSSLDT